MVWKDHARPRLCGRGNTNHCTHHKSIRTEVAEGWSRGAGVGWDTCCGHSSYTRWGYPKWWRYTVLTLDHSIPSCTWNVTHFSVWDTSLAHVPCIEPTSGTVTHSQPQHSRCLRKSGREWDVVPSTPRTRRVGSPPTNRRPRQYLPADSGRRCRCRTYSWPRHQRKGMRRLVCAQRHHQNRRDRQSSPWAQSDRRRDRGGGTKPSRTLRPIVIKGRARADSFAHDPPIATKCTLLANPSVWIPPLTLHTIYVGWTVSSSLFAPAVPFRPVIGPCYQKSNRLPVDIATVDQCTPKISPNRGIQVLHAHLHDTRSIDSHAVAGRILLDVPALRDCRTGSTWPHRLPPW